MASTDARLFPRKNQAYRVTFVIFDEDGDLVPSATSLDSEISKDGGVFADCTNEAVEIGQGFYYLDLTPTEMDADTVAIIVKTASAGAKSAPIVLYPIEDGDVDVNLTAIDGLATDGNNAILNLKQLNIVNSAGSALVATASGGNGSGIAATGNGSGDGLKLVAGATGDGLRSTGGATSGKGVRATATATADYNNLFDVTEPAEPAAATPLTGATAWRVLQALRHRWYSKNTVTSSQHKVFKSDDVTVLDTMAVSNDGTTVTKGKTS